MTAASRTRVGALSPAGLRAVVVRTAPPPRHSAVTTPSGPLAGFADVHLRADPDAPEEARWSEHADVLGCRRPSPARQAGLRAARLLARHPGCLVAAVPRTGGGCAVGVRGGPPLAALPVAAGARLTADECGALASFLHAWLVAGRAVEAPEAVVLWRPGGTLWARVVRG